MINSVKLHSRAPGFDGWCYVDRSEYYADSIFLKHGLRPIFMKMEFTHPDHPGYSIVFCRIRKKHRAAVLAVFQELSNKILLLGHREYVDVCDFFAQMVEEGRIQKYNNL